MALTFLDKLGAEAEAFARTESDYRAESRRRLETLAADRTRAFRRYNLLKGMAGAAGPDMEPEVAIRASVAFATQETGWSESAEGYGDLCEQLGKVAAGIHDEVCRAALDDAATNPGQRPPDVEATFADFESWHRERFGGEFLDRLQREAIFYPSVDF